MGAAWYNRRLRSRNKAPLDGSRGAAPATRTYVRLCGADLLATARLSHHAFQQFAAGVLPTPDSRGASRVVWLRCRRGHRRGRPHALPGKSFPSFQAGVIQVAGRCARDHRRESGVMSSLSCHFGCATSSTASARESRMKGAADGVIMVRYLGLLYMLAMNVR